MHSWYVKHVVFVLELLSTLDIHLDIFGYLTKIDYIFDMWQILDMFWHIFATFAEISRPHDPLERSYCGPWSGDPGDPGDVGELGDLWQLERLSPRRSRAQVTSGQDTTSWLGYGGWNRGWTWNRLGTDLEQRDFSIFNTCFLLLPPCLLEVELRYTCLGQNWPVRPVTKLWQQMQPFEGAIFFVTGQKSFLHFHPCARHLWTLRIHKAVTLILAWYKMSANWVTWRFQHCSKMPMLDHQTREARAMVLLCAAVAT